MLETIAARAHRGDRQAAHPARVSHGMRELCIQVLKPLAAEAAAIAQPAHMLGA